MSRVTLCTNLFIYKSFTPPFHFSFIVMSSATSTPDCLCDNQCKLLTKGLSKFLCSTNNCNFELPLCHCKVPARIYSSKTHNYFCCRDKNCSFLIPRCSCGKICSIRLSQSFSNPGFFYWNCNDCNYFEWMKGSFLKHIKDVYKEDILFIKFIASLEFYMERNYFLHIMRDFFHVSQEFNLEQCPYEKRLYDFYLKNIRLNSVQFQYI